MKTTSWSWSSAALVRGHLHGHAEVDVIIDGFGDQVQKGLPQLCELRNGFFWAPGFMWFVKSGVDEFVEWGILGVEIAEDYLEDTGAV